MRGPWILSDPSTCEGAVINDRSRIFENESGQSAAGQPN